MNSLRNKITLFLLSPIILLAIGYFSVSEFVLKRDFIRHLESEAIDKTATMSARFKDVFLSGDRAGLAQKVFEEKYNNKEIRYVIIYNAEDNVIADSFVGEDPAIGLTDDGLHDEAAYYLALAKGANGSNEQIYNVEKPISAGLYALGMVRVGYDFEHLRKDYLFSLYLSLGIGVISFAFVIFLAHKLSNIIVKPLDDLTKTISNYANGNYDSFAKVGSLDEIGDLAVTFNMMKSNLEESRKKLVNEKKAVEAKAAELESWQKTAVARELKMIELKNKIKELESRSSGNKQ